MRRKFIELFYFVVVVVVVVAVVSHWLRLLVAVVQLSATVDSQTSYNTSKHNDDDDDKNALIGPIGKFSLLLLLLHEYDDMISAPVSTGWSVATSARCWLCSRTTNDGHRSFVALELGLSRIVLSVGWRVDFVIGHQRLARG